MNQWQIKKTTERMMHNKLRKQKKLFSLVQNLWNSTVFTVCWNTWNINYAMSG